jgi:hypothetical protein
LYFVSVSPYKYNEGYLNDRTAPGGAGSGEYHHRRGCTVADFGAVADNMTDNSAAFRAATKSGCSEILVPPGVWMT